MNVLVTGSNGNLGCELRRLAADSTDRFVFTDIGEMPGADDSLISLGFITDIQGGYHFMGYFSYFDEYAYFWTSDEIRGRNARSVMFAKGSPGVSFDETYEEFALSVRCVRSTN